MAPNGPPGPAVQVTDPFVAAYGKLKEFVREGHTQHEVTEFAQQLNRLYVTKRGSRPLIGVARIVSQSTPQCSRRRSR
jgi:hypothetical protein